MGFIGMVYLLMGRHTVYLLMGRHTSHLATYGLADCSRKGKGGRGKKIKLNIFDLLGRIRGWYVS